MRVKLVVGTAVGIFFAAYGTIGSSAGGIEATTASYIVSNGNVLVTGSGGCVHSRGWSDGDKIGACEGEELVAKAETPEPTTVAVAPPPPPPPPPAPVVAPVADEVVLVGRTMFQSDSALLTTEGSNEMRKLAAMLRSYESIKRVEVIGHTDSVGSSEYNQSLSERRAETVKEWFEVVVPGFPVTARGAGESTPLASNDTDEGRALNRRVEIMVDAVR